MHQGILKRMKKKWQRRENGTDAVTTRQCLDRNVEESSKFLQICDVCVVLCFVVFSDQKGSQGWLRFEQT